MKQNNLRSRDGRWEFRRKSVVSGREINIGLFEFQVHKRIHNKYSVCLNRVFVELFCVWALSCWQCNSPNQKFPVVTHRWKSNFFVVGCCRYRFGFFELSLASRKINWMLTVWHQKFNINNFIVERKHDLMWWDDIIVASFALYSIISHTPPVCSCVWKWERERESEHKNANSRTSSYVSSTEVVCCLERMYRYVALDSYSERRTQYVHKCTGVYT